MKVLVLGHKGMLGHMVVKHLEDNDAQIHVIVNRWPSSKQEIVSFNGDYIINCIGAIPQRTKDFDINWELPIWLDLHSPCQVIHPGTDCEMDDDDYGKSKKVAADYLNGYGFKTKILKTSIIGPELDSVSSLFEWFLSQKGEVFGYTKAMWNGVTTLEWSKQCLKLMNNWGNYASETIIQGECLSKYELLNLIKLVFDKDVKISPKDLGKNKCLVGEIHAAPMMKQLKELKAIIN